MKKIMNWVSHGANGENKAAMKPRTVIGATAGAANKLAMMLMGDKYPERDTRMGEQKMIAAIGGASEPANFLCVGSLSTIRGASKSNPAVANTDKANPASRDCQGSPRTTAQIAKPKAGKESDPRLPSWADNKTAAIAAARNTDGDGRTKAMKQASAIAVAIIRTFLRRIRNCMHHSTKVETIAKFAPLTATKWVNPERFIASLNSGDCLEVSPNTIPGINAPASPVPEFSRSPWRIAPSPDAQEEGAV